MKIKIIQEISSSFVTRGQELIAKGNTREAMKLIARGLQDYSDRVLEALSPYPAEDAGLVVLVLRHLADEIERNNPGAKEFYEGMKKCVVCPPLEEIQKVKKARRRW